MTNTLSALRIHIGIFGRTNVGKSSVFNLITGQSHSIVSNIAGTTTDCVKKAMELPPLGPVLFYDTAGIDDTSILAQARNKKTQKIFTRLDIILLITEPTIWTDYEQEILTQAQNKKIPVITVVNKIDTCKKPLSIKKESIAFSCREAQKNKKMRKDFLTVLTNALEQVCPKTSLEAPGLLDGLIHFSNKKAPQINLVVPLDSGAPKGRLIMPQVQVIREALDAHCMVHIARDSEYKDLLHNQKKPPQLVICDSQLAGFVAKHTDKSIPLTTFSILFSRAKGDITSMAKGAASMMLLKKNARILIAEACSHHAMKDDIGTVLIPHYLQSQLGKQLYIEHSQGKDFPEHIASFDLIIHCGACTLTRKEMLFRIQQAKTANVPITNYGIALAVFQGVGQRMFSPFPETLGVWEIAQGSWQ